MSRRVAIQAGSIGLLGLGMNHLAPLRALADTPRTARAKSVIYIFLSGGLAQQDSFDMKPDAPQAVPYYHLTLPTKASAEFLGAPLRPKTKL